MFNYSSLLEIVNKELQNCNLIKEPKELYEPIEYILSIGGKRLRPVLMLMAYNLFSDNIQNAIKPALGLEIFHNFTLLHDDIMDKSEKRRNKPTVHKKWSENIAILSGDAMSILAYKFICSCENSKLPQVLDVFTKTALQVCEGQQFDMNFETSQNVSIEEYLKMIELKTSVLLAGSLKIGAIIGNADAEDANNLYDFGINIGLAFQLQDDILDVYGDTDKFGKNIGGDIVSNKKTFLLLKAMEVANAEKREELLKWINLKEFDRSEKIEAVTSIYKEFKVKELAEDLKNEYFEKSLINLDKIKSPNSRKIHLLSISKKLMNREY